MAACRLHDISRRPTGWRRRCARAVGGGLETDPGGVTTAHQPRLVRSATADQSPSLGVQPTTARPSTSCRPESVFRRPADQSPSLDVQPTTARPSASSPRDRRSQTRSAGTSASRHPTTVQHAAARCQRPHRCRHLATNAEFIDRRQAPAASLRIVLTTSSVETEDRDEWRKYVHGVAANPPIEVGQRTEQTISSNWPWCDRQNYSLQ